MQGYLGVVFDTVRASLVEWIAGSLGVPKWEPAISMACVELGLSEILGDVMYLTCVYQQNQKERLQ